jgi:hypothetical protein
MNLKPAPIHPQFTLNPQLMHGQFESGAHYI